jgi:hypothetical protein
MASRRTFFLMTWLLAAAASLAGCGRTSRIAMSGPDAATDVPASHISNPDDDATPDSTRDTPKDATVDQGADTATATACSTGLSGVAPFGAQVSGSFTFEIQYSYMPKPAPTTINAYIYFPAGRVAGAPAQLAVQSQKDTTHYFFGPQVTLASDLSATGLTVSGDSALGVSLWGIKGDLLPGTGGLQAEISENVNYPNNDVGGPEWHSTFILMCPSGDVPAPSLHASWGTVSPFSTLQLSSTTPLTTEALNALRITSPLGAVAFTVSDSGNSYFTIKASSAFPPGQPLSLDASAMKDVLGRTVPIDPGEAHVLATTTVLSDLTFSTTPPTGAIACSSGCSTSAFEAPDGGASAGMIKCTGGEAVADGVLTIDNGVVALLALPATNATKLRVRLASDVNDAGEFSSYGWTLHVFATVVGPNGEASAKVDLGAAVTADINLPDASPLWLVVQVAVDGPEQRPYYSPMYSPTPPPVSIDELEFI